MAALLVGGGWIGRNDLVNPPGRLIQKIVRRHLRNHDEAPLGELAYLTVAQHSITLERQQPWQRRDFCLQSHVSQRADAEPAPFWVLR